MVLINPYTSIDLVKNTLSTICGTMAQIETKKAMYDQFFRNKSPSDPTNPLTTARPKTP